jgi:hypothetical protein
MQALSHEFVVLAYGDSPYLPDCLASVCRQSGSRVTVTTPVLSPYISDMARSHCVPVQVSQGRRGIAADWNFALDCATADLVTLAHQDDLYYPDFAQQTRALFGVVPNASLCFTDYEEIDDRGNPLARGRVLRVKHILRALAVGGREVVQSRAGKRGLLAFGSVVPCPSVTLNRKVIQGFRFSEDYQINLDWDAWWRLHLLDHPFVFSRRVLMGHRLHREAETSRSKQDGRRREEDRRMFHRIWPAPIAGVLASLYRVGY